MAGQYSGGEEEEWKVASKCGLHKFEQGLPKRPIPYALNRSVSGYNCRPSRMSFLDAFQRYHQIPLALGDHQILLALGDQEKTAFVTPTRNYHYKVTPFRLKNAGSTYQRMMTKMFEPRLGKNIEVYIDDMVVKVRL